MLNFGDKTLLQRQLDAYKKNGIKDISLIRGYKKEKINYKGIKYFENKDYKNNNILNSIFTLKKLLMGISLFHTLIYYLTPLWLKEH